MTENDIQLLDNSSTTYLYPMERVHAIRTENNGSIDLYYISSGTGANPFAWNDSPDGTGAAWVNTALRNPRKGSTSTDGIVTCVMTAAPYSIIGAAIAPAAVESSHIAPYTIGSSNLQSTLSAAVYRISKSVAVGATGSASLALQGGTATVLTGSAVQDLNITSCGSTSLIATLDGNFAPGARVTFPSNVYVADDSVLTAGDNFITVIDGHASIHSYHRGTPAYGSAGVFVMTGAQDSSHIVSSGMVMGSVGLHTALSFQNVYSGGVAMDTDVSTAGLLTVYSGGRAIRPVVSANTEDGAYTKGSMAISAGGVVHDAFIGSGAECWIYGTLENATTEVWAYVNAGNSSVINNCNVNSGTNLTMSSGSLLQNSIIVGGISHRVPGTTAMCDTSASVVMLAGGSASNCVIRESGYLTQSAGAVTSNLTVSSGGTLIVSSAAYAASVSSKAGANITVIAGGTITYR